MQIRNDELIKTEIVTRLRWDDRADGSQIAVTVDAGNVMLEGHVSSYAAKLIAASAAWMTGGVKSVTNQLEVKNLPAPADSQIKSVIEGNLRWNTYLSDDSIEVSINNGQVTLEGTVSSYWRKTQAVDLVSGTNGVTDIVDKLAVVPTEKRVDEAVANDIVAAISRDLRTDINDINVVVGEGGAVTLSGTVPNAIAKDAAYNAARYTFGVTEVSNCIMVTDD